MREEEVIDETHRVRREISAQFHDDVHLFFEYLRQREVERPGQVVVLDRIPPNTPSTMTAPSTAQDDTGA